jgi:hypothetical protein
MRTGCAPRFMAAAADLVQNLEENKKPRLAGLAPENPV